MKTYLNNKGSIALISVIVISAILLIVAIGMSEAHISSAYQYANSASNKITYYLGEACLEEAIIRIEDDPSFNGETVEFDTGIDCTISVTGSSTKTVSITANYLNYTQNFQSQVAVTSDGEANNAALLNWGEI